MRDFRSKAGTLLVAIMLGLAGCTTQSQQRTGEYVEDSWITTKVKSDMVANNEVAARNITVNTSNGVVTLSGTAKTREEADKAVQIASGIKGVTSVENHIKVE